MFNILRDSLLVYCYGADSELFVDINDVHIRVFFFELERVLMEAVLLRPRGAVGEKQVDGSIWSACNGRSLQIVEYSLEWPCK